jgi:hypothetical protein
VYPRAEGAAGQLDLHVLSAGAALASLTLWLDELAASLRQDSSAGLPASLVVVTGWGKGSRVTGVSEVKNVVTAFLAAHSSPFHVPHENPGCLLAERAVVEPWLRSVAPLADKVQPGVPLEGEVLCPPLDAQAVAQLRRGLGGFSWTASLEDASFSRTASLEELREAEVTAQLHLAPPSRNT